MAPIGSNDVGNDANAVRPFGVWLFAKTCAEPICVLPFEKITVPDGKVIPELDEPANAGEAILAVRDIVLP